MQCFKHLCQCLCLKYVSIVEFKVHIRDFLFAKASSERSLQVMKVLREKPQVPEIMYNFKQNVI